jgi:hypothetical protein
MDGSHPSDNDPNDPCHPSNQGANIFLDTQDSDPNFQPFPPEDFGDQPEEPEFSNEGWQGPVHGNDDASSMSDIDDDLIHEGGDEGHDLMEFSSNEQNPPIAAATAPPPGPVAASPVNLPAGNADNPPSAGLRAALPTEPWSFQNSYNDPIDLDATGISENLQNLGEAIMIAVSTTSAITAAGIGSSNTSNPPVASGNAPAGPSNTPNSPAAGTNPATGLSNTSNPQAAALNPPDSPSITPSPAIQALRIETAIRSMADRLTAVERSNNILLTTYQRDQRVLFPALAQFTRASSDQQSFTRAVLTGMEIRHQWQLNVDASLERIANERELTNSDMDRILHVMERLGRLQVNTDRHLNDIRVNLQRFVSSYDVNRTVVEERQRLILSQVSWLEPVALFFQSWRWFLSLFAFWTWGRAGRYGPPHQWPRGVPPPPPPPPPPGGGGGGEDGDGDGGGGLGGGLHGGQGDQQLENQQVGNQQGGQQPAGNQPAARLAPGQIGSPIRIGGRPYQPYRRPSDPNHEPLIPLFSERESSASGRQVIIICFFIALIILTWGVKYFQPDLWASHVPYVAPTATRHPGASVGYKRAAAPGMGAWLDEPVMKAMFGAQNDAQSVAALAAESAESVIACAKLVEDSSGVTTQLKQDWHGVLTRDTEGTCKKAVQLGAEAAEKMKALAGRLEWVFGEKWWATLTSTERSVWKTAIGEGVKMAAGEVVVDETTMATMIATEIVTETGTAGWWLAKRRVLSWF